MASSANGDLFSVDRPQNVVETVGFPFVGEFADMSDMMHDNWSCILADATRLTKFRARSHLDRYLYQVNIRCFPVWNASRFLAQSWFR